MSKETYLTVSTHNYAIVYMVASREAFIVDCCVLGKGQVQKLNFRRKLSQLSEKVEFRRPSLLDAKQSL